MRWLEAIKTQIVNPLITLLALAAFVVFIWGLMMFIWKSGDAEARETGRRMMFWGIIGLVILFGAQAIVALMTSVVNSIG